MENNMSVKAILFDFFGVISSEVSPFWFAERFEAEEAKRLKEEYMSPADRGDVSEEETFRRLSQLSGETPDEIRADFCRRAIINPEMVELVEGLRERYKTVLVSNAMEKWLTEIMTKNDLHRLFDAVVISAKEKAAKPDCEIFGRALLSAGVKAEEAIFIDDNKKNADGAKAVGIDGIVFKDRKTLVGELRVRGIM